VFGGLCRSGSGTISGCDPREWWGWGRRPRRGASRRSPVGGPRCPPGSGGCRLL